MGNLAGEAYLWIVAFCPFIHKVIILLSLISFLNSHVSLDICVTKFSDTSFMDVNFLIHL